MIKFKRAAAFFTAVVLTGTMFVSCKRDEESSSSKTESDSSAVSSSEAESSSATEDSKDEDYAYPMDKFTDITQIAVALNDVVGLKKDGTVVSSDGTEIDVSSWSDISKIDCTLNAVFGLKNDGTVVACSDSSDLKVTDEDISAWKDLTDIACGDYFTVGLQKDGKAVYCYAQNQDAQELQLDDISEWSDIKQIDAGSDFAAALKSDGTVVVSGAAACIDKAQVSEWKDVTAIYCTQYDIIAVTKSGDAYLSNPLLVQESDGTLNLIDEDGFWNDGWSQSALYTSRNSSFIIGVTEDGKVMTTEKNKFAECENWTDLVDVDYTYQGNSIFGVLSDGTVISIGN
ncbi:MAG: hypothetical protein ACI4I6_01970 [Hominimerdicola sp.]